jgi:hypothetical protein
LKSNNSSSVTKNVCKREGYSMEIYLHQISGIK